MFGRRTINKSRKRNTRPARWTTRLATAARSGLVRCGLVAVLLVLSLWATAAAVGSLERHVDRKILGRLDRPTMSFLEMSGTMRMLALPDLERSVSDLLMQPWTDTRLCRAMANRLRQTGWVDHVRYVRRTADVRFEVSARYREPFAQVQTEDGFFLVDRGCVRLPGVYAFSNGWILIQGVEESVPPVGTVWPGDDVRAGVELASLIALEPFDSQISAVLVGNVKGKQDPTRVQIELATDVHGGRILWGSLPGREVEETTIAQKLAILRANFHRFGRADAGHAVIDVSIFPDRFTTRG